MQPDSDITSAAARSQGATGVSPVSSGYTSSSSNQIRGPHTAPTVLLIGPWQHAEFSAIRAELDTANQWPTANSLATAIELLPIDPSPPDLILLAQARPGVDCQEDVERLRRVAPHTHVIVVAGTWCEGELRTGQPLTGVVRLYWYELPPWWRANCRRWAQNRSPSWAEPLTAIRPGQFLRFDAGVDSSTQQQTRRLALDSTDYAVFEALNAGLATCGWTSIWQPRHRPHLNRDLAEPPTAAIWDGAQLSPTELESLTQLCTRMSAHSAPVIALLDFPRVEHLNIAKAAGAAAIFAKPYQLALLHNELLRLTNLAAASSSQ